MNRFCQLTKFSILNHPESTDYQIISNSSKKVVKVKRRLVTSIITLQPLTELTSRVM